MDSGARIGKVQHRGDRESRAHTQSVVFDPYEALVGVHAATVVTEWEAVRNLELARMADLMESPKLLVAGRNTMDPAAAREAGLLYRGFGRG